jgi:3-oxoacyl-[acyl-carrier-protein] synthase II
MSERAMQDVVITGVGLITPIGSGTEAFWEGLMAGRSGAGHIKAYDASDQPVQIACEVDDFDPSEHMDRREIGRTDPFTHLAVAAAALAWEEAGGDDLGVAPERIGVIVGSGIGGLQTTLKEHESFLRGGPRRVSPFMIPRLMPNGAAAAIAMKYGLWGLNFAPTSACATGAHAIGEAYRAIKTGAADVMLAGGSESALTKVAMAAFARMGALSRRNDDPERASRPFDKDRDGFVFGEGAGVLVLENRELAERRGAPMLAELAGYGASSDAFHVTQPDPEGRGAAFAMRAALEDAGENLEDVDYINAHGTSTPFNDRVETLAIRKVFGEQADNIPVSSTKSQTGHLLGAAGAVEAIVCALAIQRGVIPQTINLEEPDPECDLDYVPEGPREAKVRLTLSNAFGFGGQNAVLAVRALR